MEYQKQVERLVDELREKSDSESFEDEIQKKLDVTKVLRSDKLKQELENALLEIKQLKHDYEANLARMQSNLKYSRDANQSIKNDYDGL